MKFHSRLWILLVLALVLSALTEVEAGYGGRRRADNYYYPPDAAPPQLPPDQNDPSRPAPPNQPPKPAEKQEKFKDVPLNTTFYFPADKNKAFPKMKISDTTAKTVKDGKMSQVPPATLVVVTGETNKVAASPKK